MGYNQSFGGFIVEDVVQKAPAAACSFAHVCSLCCDGLSDDDERTELVKSLYSNDARDRHNIPMWGFFCCNKPLRCRLATFAVVSVYPADETSGVDVFSPHNYTRRVPAAARCPSNIWPHISMLQSDNEETHQRLEHLCLLHLHWPKGPQDSDQSLGSTKWGHCWTTLAWRCIGFKLQPT